MEEAGKEMTAGQVPGAVPVADGLIVSHFGVAVEVLFASGERRMVRVKRNSGHVVGDRVRVIGEVLERLPRTTELRRRDARGSVHLVAANLDVLGIVLAPGSPAGFADRAIVAARAAGLKPFLVCNKCDLPEARDLAGNTAERYKGTVATFALSAATGEGIVQLCGFLREGHRGAFVGSTGVGKSSLLNTLCPDINLKVGEVSGHRWLGKHTTTVSSLHTVPGGGELVDTPGFRDFGLVDISSQEVVEYFPGFEALEAHACRFHNCRHRSEPGCSVAELVTQGQIPPDRYRCYLEILAEAEESEEAASRRTRKR
ncbi:MAG TPA: ribosome small subunit-dependent GTPase A [Geomonas sp.]|nr:ribosome small subunit-dependent GTPase A [Geomonas sp.]